MLRSVFSRMEQVLEKTRIEESERRPMLSQQEKDFRNRKQLEFRFDEICDVEGKLTGIDIYLRVGVNEWKNVKCVHMKNVFIADYFGIESKDIDICNNTIFDLKSPLYMTIVNGKEALKHYVQTTTLEEVQAEIATRIQLIKDYVASTKKVCVKSTIKIY